MQYFIQIHPSDNVAVALRDLSAGTVLPLNSRDIRLETDIAKGHKFTLCDITVGQALKKYGAVIGEAVKGLKSGALVDEHSIKTRLDDVISYTYEPKLCDLPRQPSRDVQVYRRSQGLVGIRNELWIIPTVSCVNGVAANIAKAFLRENACDDIDGVHVFPHQFGCSQLGDDLEYTRNILRCLVLHPNAGGVLVLGLGCESNQIAELKLGMADIDPARQKFLVTQSVEDEVESGKLALAEIYQQIRHDRRTTGNLSELCFGLECGGSDGLSGITANPLLGAFSDRVIAQGGSSVLTEVPEMFGAETLLMERCRSEEVFLQLVDMVNEFKHYYKRHQQPIYENPSPGNKAGGISTLEEKSLGCTQKAGCSTVEAVVGYGQRIHAKGLNLLNAPGNDAIATTALAAAGCHMVLFTTGRGTPYGGAVPTVKVATNSELAKRKKHWIDFDAGPLVEGAAMETLLEGFIDQLVLIINGEQTQNERNDFRELAIWKQGVTL
ncbi:UxaA family hydrolase [Teredinibacter haidensis]|uniref:UxaA family hydrolase n=1 Tax=Teredinibacter haidensis TaxID=2731755 RepID=UPI000948D779|nr:altronate dehydratase family protein [Teredinibacter haidensis]